jgi:AGZA family xanthine/uracil permease-like MFS transporter
MLERLFQLTERNTTFRRELLAGATTFLTMAYIIFVNPGILSAAGIPFEAAATATAVGAAIMCVLMGLVTNRPLALASGMGLNAVLAFSIIGINQAKIPWPVGMSIIVVEGLLILLLVLTGLREAVMHAIPMNLKRAIGGGIGLFITVIGLNEGGLIRPAPITLVSLGDLSRPFVWVTLIGLAAILLFRSRRMKADILWGVLVATAAALLFDVTKLPAAVVATPDFSSFFAPLRIQEYGLPLFKVFTPTLMVAVFAIMLTDFFDTMGTVVAVGEQAGFADKEGRVPGLKGILAVDSIAATLGGLFGASSITTYIESAAGVAEGGRTGLTAIVTGLLFAASAFLAPVIAMIGGGFKLPNTEQYSLLVGSGFTVTGESFLYPITAGALIFVGFLMMKTVREIDWDKFDEAFPAFLTFVGIPLTYNISHGIGLGFIAHVLLKIMHGRFKEIHPLMLGVSAAFLLSFILSCC